jgi:hypothetical protein
MKLIKTESERSNFIGELAIKAKCKGVEIPYEELKQNFADNGSEMSILEVIRAITKAYHDWMIIDKSVSEAIAQTYYGRNGMIIIL